MNYLKVLEDRAREMRLKPTKHERIFLERLINKNIRFQSQAIIGQYIVDFLIDKYIIEIDGYSHNEKDAQLYDFNRDKFLRSSGFTVIRIPNSESISYPLNKFVKKRAPIDQIYNKKKLEAYSSKQPRFKYLPNKFKRIILQRERLYGTS